MTIIWYQRWTSANHIQDHFPYFKSFLFGLYCFDACQWAWLFLAIWLSWWISSLASWAFFPSIFDKRYVYIYIYICFLGVAPLPVTVTTRIIIFLVGDSYKLLLSTITTKGHIQYIYIYIFFFIDSSGCWDSESFWWDFPSFFTWSCI